MSDRISVKKLRRMLEAFLDWRNARPVETKDGTAQTEFSRGYETFAKDLNRDLDELEKKENQRNFFRNHKQ